MFGLVVTVASNRLAGFLLALVRSSAWLIITPPFSSNSIPQRVKIGLAAALALILAPSVTVTPDLYEIGPFAFAVIYQAFVGVLLGFTVYLIFVVVQMGGDLIDLQAGFSAAQLYDPFTNATATPIARLYQLMATTLLFVGNGHLVLVRGFMTSFRAAPLGTVNLRDVANLFTTQLGTLLLSAMEIAGPLLAALFLTEITLGMLSRAAPQVNVMTIGFIVKIGLALLMVGLALPVLPDALDTLLSHSVGSMTRLAGR